MAAMLPEMARGVFARPSYKSLQMKSGGYLIGAYLALA
jgi:hypothetical protein